MKEGKALNEALTALLSFGNEKRKGRGTFLYQS